MEPIEREIKKLIVESRGQVSVAYCRPASNERLLIRPDQFFHAASTMKVCVLAELYRQVDAGMLSLSDTMQIQNQFASIADGSEYSLSRKDDSEKKLYRRLGEQISLISLGVRMINYSSNLATNLLIEKLSAKNVNDFMETIVPGGFIIRRGVENGKAYRQGMNNQVTALGLAVLFTAILNGGVVSERASGEMIGIMLGQKHRNCIPAKLPADCRVANKTGWNSEACHDAAIVIPPANEPYVLVVLTNGLDPLADGPELISTISRMIYDWSVSCP